MIDHIVGLSISKVEENQKKYGPNTLAIVKHIPFLLKILKKFSNPLILILLFSSLLSIFLGQKTDFLIIFLILFLSVVLDTYQEHRAQHAAEKLAQKITRKAKVIRDGKTIDIQVKDITIDDIVLVSVGNIIPADCRILNSNNLSVDQSALTGESFPQEKNINDSVYMGTHVISGFATLQVIAIGQKTAFGKISRQIIAPKPPTEFETGLNKFSYLLGRIALVSAIFILVFNTIFGHNFISSLMFVLALSIGFAPELLPVILTINLSKGALHLSHHGVIVKYLPSIENFGSMDILCTDKTGTLTEGQINLDSWINFKGEQDNNVLTLGYLNSHFQTGFNNPIDDAILKSNINLPKNILKIDEISYDFYRKRSSLILKQGRKNIIITKGAPQLVLPLCTNLSQNKFDLEKFNDQGFRVIAVAAKQVKSKDKYTSSDENNLQLKGFLLFSDPPKKSIINTLTQLKEHGISLKILTGDNEIITRHVCREIGLAIENVLSNHQIEKMTDQDLDKIVDKTNLFSELTPDSKLRIILSLKRNNHVVGYLGDGINDATTLKNADVGISVDNAVDIAKESADLILLRKDLNVLLVGIQEGRSTFNNIMKYIWMETSSTFGNMLSLSVASLILPFLPMLPIHVLLNDLLYGVSQTVLVKDNIDNHILLRPYRWDINLLKKFTVIFGSISSVFDMVTFFLLYVILHESPIQFQTGWFLESAVSQTLIVFSIRTTIVPFFKSRPSFILSLVLLSLSAFVLFLPFSFLAPEFHLVQLPTIYFVFLLFILISYFSLVEIAKIFFFRHHPQK